jgi:HPt (histidine-containing phosphotransfer) domain-containing protein
MTAAALPSDRQRSLDAGMDDHLVKPVRARELEAVLARFLSPAGAEAAPDPVDAIAAAMGGAFDRLVGAYLADAAASLETLRDAAARGETETVAAVAHRLKGSSGIVGANAVAALCQALVDDPLDPAPRIERLSRELAHVRPRLLASAGQPR